MGGSGGGGKGGDAARASIETNKREVKEEKSLTFPIKKVGSSKRGGNTGTNEGKLDTGRVRGFTSFWGG